MHHKGETMKRATAALALFLALPLVGLAQTQHFSLSGSAISFMGPAGSAPASIADGSFNVTQRVSFGYQQITIPQLATAKLGTLSYSAPLSSFVGKKMTAKFVFDASKISVNLLAGAGKLNQTTLNVNRIAETVGACLSYPLGANVSAKVVCGQWLHGGIVNGILSTGVPGTPTSSSNAVISSGISVHF
jgi:hypothetical protein